MISLLRSKKIITMVVDFGLGYLALLVALVLRHLEFPKGGAYTQGVIPFGIISLFHVLVFYISGLYTLQDLRSFATRLQRTVYSFVISSGLSLAVFYLLPDDSYSPKTILLLYSLSFFLLFLLWRNISPAVLGGAYPRLRVAFLGFDPIVEEVLCNDDLLSAYNLDCRLLFRSPAASDTECPNREGLASVNSVEELRNELQNQSYDLIVIHSEMNDHDAVRDLLFHRLSRNAVYMSLPEFYEMTMARVPINAINQMWFLEHLEFRNKVAYEKFKRLGDLVVGLLALIVTLPLWPLVALLVKLSSSGPILFSQIRAGQLGQPYTIYKFRTMRTEGNSFSMTVEGDSRITGVGRFLRKSRLDEIPQLINIICGDMSFVGPRPERPELIEELEKEVPFYRQRMLVKPGLTGWDQVSGEYHSASVEDTYKKLQYDLYYVKNRSFYLDAIIVLKTISTVFRRAGR